MINAALSERTSQICSATSTTLELVDQKEVQAHAAGPSPVLVVSLKQHDKNYCSALEKLIGRVCTQVRN